MNKFGKNSVLRISSCELDIQLILYVAIKRSLVDFGVAEGHRDLARQYKLFLRGKSKIDGKVRKGKHNYFPSKAFDIYVYHPVKKDIAYDFNHLCYIAGIIQSVARELYNNGEIDHLIRWGGNWNNDGIIILDQKFRDLVHFEIYKPI